MERAPVAVFVYGTLMPGECRWPVLHPFATGWQRASARGFLWDTGRGFPGAAFSADGGNIPGVRVTVAADRWAVLLGRLDRIEGALYRRVDVETSGGPAAAYEWTGATAGLRRLPHGWARRADGAV